MKIEYYDAINKMKRMELIEILEKHHIPCYSTHTVWELRRSLIVGVESFGIPKNLIKL